MDYFEAPQDYDAHADQTAVFLAGGIGNCPNWQAEATDMLNGTELLVLNPRRAHFETPWTRLASEGQIRWEFDALRRADIILFWFPGGESVQPIAMFELGFWLGQYDRPLVIGRSPQYPRKDDIDIQVSLARPKQDVYTSLAACMDAVEIAAERHPRAPKAWH
jgi:nucleoside 2-deoxyribosyltransferase-like protein